MTHTLKCAFYLVAPSEPPVSDVLAGIAGRPKDARFHFASKKKDHGYSVTALDQDGTLWLGDLTHVRLRPLPPRANTAGDIGDLVLEAQEGLGTQAAFIYDSATRTLLVEQNQQAGHSQWGAYIQKVGGSKAPISLTPMLLRNPEKRAQGFRKVRSLKMDLAIAKIGSLKRPSLVAALKDLQTDLDAHEVTLDVKQPGGSGLNFGNTMKFVGDLLSSRKDDPEAVPGLHLYGWEREDNRGPIEHVDLISDRAKFEREIDYPDGGNRSVPYGLRAKSLREVWAAEWERVFLPYREGKG